MATMVMQDGRENTMERNAPAPRGGLTVVRGVVLLFLTTGLCELVLIGFNNVMARLLGH